MPGPSALTAIMLGVMDRKTLAKLEFDKIRERLVSCCASSLGRELAERLSPFEREDVVRARMAETTEAVGILERRGRVPFGGISDFGPALERARVGSALAGEDFVQLRDALHGAGELGRVVSPEAEVCPRVGRLACEMPEFTALRKRIESTIDDDGRVVDGASPELARIRSQRRRLERHVQERMASFLTEPEVQRALQDRLITLRRNRPCLPVRAEFKRSIPGVVHDTSASGATVFIEPAAVVELGDEFQRLAVAEAEEVARILRELTLSVAERYDDLAHLRRLLAILDFVFARGRLSGAMGAEEPELVAEPRMVLVKARHPLIAADVVVPIDVAIGEEYDLLLITGPNTGGKTVALKTMGLLAAMSLSGLHIPADRGTRIPLLPGLFADIGDEQSIEQSLSTFSSHISNIAHILRRAPRGSLVLLDEIGVGTDPDEGAALAVAILRHLLSRGVLVAATTHYGALKTFGLQEPRAQNASVEFDPDTLAPTFRLRTGVPGSSNALAIAKRIGLPREVIAAARDIVPRERVRIEEAILETERARRDYESRARALTQATREHERLAALCEERAEQLAEERKRALKDGWHEAKRLVADAREEARQALAELRRQPKEGRATQQVQEELRRLAERVEVAAEDAEAPEPAPPPDVRPGDVVLVRGLGQRGVVLEPPGADGRTAISIGAARAEVDTADLERVDAVTDPAMRDAIGVIRVTKSLSVPREVHLRGMRVEEALDRLEKFLDDASLAEHRRVFIVHGKGTGALRDAVREYLRSDPRARSFEYAEQSEGGVGVTVVDLA